LAQWKGKHFKWTKALYKFNLDVFGNRSFRHNQREVTAADRATTNARKSLAQIQALFEHQ
jgi:hypothetical protein